MFVAVRSRPDAFFATTIDRPNRFDYPERSAAHQLRERTPENQAWSYIRAKSHHATCNRRNAHPSEYGWSDFFSTISKEPVAGHQVQHERDVLPPVGMDPVGGGIWGCRHRCTREFISHSPRANSQPNGRFDKFHCECNEGLYVRVSKQRKLVALRPYREWCPSRHPEAYEARWGNRINNTTQRRTKPGEDTTRRHIKPGEGSIRRAN